MFPRLLIILLLFAASPGRVLAQAGFSTIADQLTIRLNEVVQVQYIAENATQIEGFKAPAFRDFTIKHGPIETSGMSLINNQVSQYRAYTYILQPLRKGRLTIPGAAAIVNGKPMVSNKLVIEVGDAVTRPVNPYPIDPGISAFQKAMEEEYLLAPGENAADKIKNNLLVKLELDKTTAYIGEPIVATYKLYTRLRSDSRVSKRPSMNGFSVYDMEEQGGPGPVLEELNGKTYQVHIIRKTQLFPLQEGEFELEPVELENSVRFLRTGSQGDGTTNRSPLQKLFDDLISEQEGNWEEHRLTISSKPARVRIRPLPPGAPASFSGAVGNFRTTGKLLQPSAAAGEPLLYEWTLEGSGNLPLVNAPAWPLPASFSLFEPQVSEELNKMVSPMEGSKKFSFTLTADSPGQYLLPPVRFSYFDPSRQQYISIDTDSATVKITPALTRKTPSSQDSQPADAAGPAAWVYWLTGAAGLLVMLATAWLIGRKKPARPTRGEIFPIDPKAAETAPAEPEKTMPASKTSDLIETARTALGQADAKTYYRSLESALWEATNERLEPAGASLQKVEALELLAKKGIPQAELEKLRKCWLDCEWALYAPDTHQELNEDLLHKTVELVESIRKP